MPNSPLLFGANNTSNNLQNQIILANGELLQNNGPKNYITYNNFENGFTTGWSLFTTTMTGVIPTGSISAGASSIGTFDAISGGVQLADTYSLRTLTGTGFVAGQGFITDPLTIDNADQAKVLTFNLYYNAIGNSAALNLSGTSSSTFAVYIYDVTNSAWIQPAGVYGMTQGSGTGVWTGTFQTTANSTQYRLAVLCINSTAATGATIYWDRFFLGPQTRPLGAVLTDPSTYTPTFTGFGTTTSVTATTARQGKFLVGQIQFTSGTNTAVTAKISLPAGLSMDASVLGPNSNVGYWGASATPFSGDIYAIPVTDPTNLYLSNGTADYRNGNTGTNWANNTTISLFFKVPIAGWSSNVEMSNSTDTRVIAAQVTGTTTSATITTNTIIPFQTVANDTARGWSTATNKYTVPVSGKYRLSTNLLLNVSTISTTTAGLDLGIFKNSNVVLGSSRFIFGNATGAAFYSPPPVTTEIDLVAGDTIYVMCTAVNGTYTAATHSDGNYTRFTIERLSGPATIAASESVGCAYANSTNTAIGTSFAVLPYAVKFYDSHNAYNTSTGIYTIPISGTYAITAAFLTSGVNLATNQGIEIQVNRNGAAATTGRAVGAGNTNNYYVAVNSRISCLAGDTIQIQAVSSVATTNASDGRYAQFSISRMGN